jgi:hypothetical protein
VERNELENKRRAEIEDRINTVKVPFETIGPYVPMQYYSSNAVVYILIAELDEVEDYSTGKNILHATSNLFLLYITFIIEIFFV